MYYLYHKEFVILKKEINFYFNIHKMLAFSIGFLFPNKQLEYSLLSFELRLFCFAVQILIENE